MTKENSKGVFITFEGMEGAGKTTQLRLLAEHLREKGYTVTVTREPGGTPTADAIRAVLLDPSLNIDPITEFHLFCAARYQHCVEVVWPALERGEIVLCDRFADSTIAYQGFARDVIAPAEIIAETDKLIKGRWPDLTFFFTPENPDECLKRALLRYEPAMLEKQKKSEKLVDIKEARFDRMAADFHRKVHKAFASQVEDAFRFTSIKHSFIQINASESIEAIQENLRKELLDFFKEKDVVREAQVVA